MNIKNFTLVFGLLIGVSAACTTARCNNYPIKVQQHRERCEKSVTAFSGPTAEIGRTLYESLSTYVATLESLTKCSSPVISSNAVAILDVVGLLSEVGISPKVILTAFFKVLKPVAAEYKKIVQSLSPYIGSLTSCIIKAIADLEYALHQIMKDYQRAGLLANVDANEIDYEGVRESVQNLTSTIARISDTVLNGCKVDNNTRDAVYVLALILDHFLIMSHGTTSSVADALYNSSSKCDSLHVYLQTVNTVVGGIANVLQSTTSTLSTSVTVLLSTVVHLAQSLNSTLNEVFGVVQGVTISVTEITQSLTKSVSGVLSVLTGSYKNPNKAQQHRERCEKSVTAFSGPTAEIGRTLYESLSTYVATLESLTKCSSPVISSNAVAILDVVGLLSEVGISPKVILTAFFKVLKPVAAEYKKIVQSLSPYIGSLTSCIIKAIADLEYALHQIMKDYQRAGLLANVDANEIDYEGVRESVQNLTSTIARISDTVLNGCKVDNNTRDAVYVLALILDHFLIMSHGTTSSVADALYNSSSKCDSLHVYLQTVNTVVGGIANVLQSTTSTLSTSVTVLLSTVVHLAQSLNSTLNEVFGVVQGVTISVTEITQSLTKSVSGVLSVLTGSYKNPNKAQQHRERCEKSVTAFSGPTAEIGRTLYESLSTYVATLESLTKCSSPVISSNAVAILDVVGLLSEVGISPKVILTAFFKVLKPVAAEYKKIVQSLSPYIGSLTSCIIKAIADLEYALHQIMKDYQRAGLLANVDANEIDYEGVRESVQNLTSTIARISDTVLNGCKVDNNTRDAVYVLALILDHFLIMSHGTTSSVADALYNSSSKCDSLHVYLQTVNTVVGGIANVLQSTTSTLSTSVTVLLSTVVHLAQSLNSTLNEVFGVVQGVTISVTEITQSLTKSVSGVLSVLTGSYKNPNKAQQHRQTCEKSVTAFSGPTAEIGRTLYESLSTYVATLESLTKCSSPVISSNAVAILDVVGLLSEVGISPKVILTAFFKVLKPVAAEYKKIVQSLSPYIGSLTSCIIKVIADLEYALHQIMKDYQRAALLANVDANEIDYEGVRESVQNLTSTIARISDTVLNGCKVDNNTRDAVYVLALILDHFLIMSHGTTSSVADALYNSSSKCDSLHVYLQTVNTVVGGIANALQSTTSTLSASVTVLLSTVVNLAQSLNSTLNEVFGVVQGVTISVTEITQSLTKSVSGALSGFTGSLAKILN